MNETEPDWDLLVFTQQWPVTVCREWMDRSPKHTCSMPEDPGAWSIHGIWPTKLHTMGPSFCNRTWHFDPNLIEPIEKRLNTSWMNIESGKEPDANSIDSNNEDIENDRSTGEVKHRIIYYR